MEEYHSKWRPPKTGTEYRYVSICINTVMSVRHFYAICEYSK